MSDQTTAATTAAADTAAASSASTTAPGTAASATTATATAKPPAATAQTSTALNADANAATTATPPDWRASFGNDEKTQKLLGRYASAEAFGKAHLDAVARISSIKAPLKEGASDEEAAAWRKDNGIPEKPDGYFEKLPNGLVIGEDDKALFSEWAGNMHKLNIPPSAVASTVQWYYQMQERETQAQQALDRQQQSEATNALRAAWGRDYSENINLVKSFMGGLQEETASMFMDATLPDGRRLMNSPEIVQWLGQKAREINPLAFIPGASGGDESKTLDERIAAIEATMGTPAYTKNEKVQSDLRMLYDRRTQLQQRGAA